MAKKTLPTFSNCYVTHLAPLRVTMPGAATEIAPDITVGAGSLSLGDRLIWAMVGKQLMVLIPN